MLLPCLSAGTIDSVAGSGKVGFAGDAGPATDALLNQPFHCDVHDGSLYIAEANNHCIRKVDLKTGVISTVAGTGQKGDTDGVANKAAFNEPYAVVADADGDLYIVDRLNAKIRKFTVKTGMVSTLAGTGEKGYSGDDGKAAEAKLREPNDCCLDGRGGLLIADVADWRIRRVDLKSGLITTFAGTGKPTGKVDRGQIGDGGPATKAVIVGARAVCVDGQGNTFICEREGNAIRKVDAKGVITTVAGTGSKGFDNGDGVKATFNGPKAIRCDKMGHLFIVDTENHAIRRLDAKTGAVTTAAGGRKGGEGDAGDALKAGLDRPHGCVVDGDGVLYIADSNNHRVRRVK
jgi:streptogramin lyase